MDLARSKIRHISPPAMIRKLGNFYATYKTPYKYRNRQAWKLFDREWYRDKNADVVAVTQDLFGHYIKHGWREGRWPNPIFDPSWYRAQYSDISRSDEDPLEHFARHGRFEGRLPSAVFSPQDYLSANPDVAKSGMEPCEHYIVHGRAREIKSRKAIAKGESIDVALGRVVDRDVRPALADLNSFATATAARLIALDEHKVDWRSRVLKKNIYRLAEDHRPAPDGLSLNYIEIAHRLNSGGLEDDAGDYDAQISVDPKDPVGTFEALFQREIGEANILEARLLKKSFMHRSSSEPSK